MIGDRLVADIRVGCVGYGASVYYRIGCFVGRTRRFAQPAGGVLGVQRWV